MTFINTLGDKRIGLAQLLGVSPAQSFAGLSPGYQLDEKKLALIAVIISLSVVIMYNHFGVHN